MAGLEEAAVRPWPSSSRCCRPGCGTGSGHWRRNGRHAAEHGPVVDAAALTASRRPSGPARRCGSTTSATTATRPRREVEPHRLVSWGRRWYLVGWDTGCADWRTFRVDRIRLRTPNGARFTPRELPDGDVTAYLRRTMGSEMWPYRIRLRVHAPAAELTGRVDGEVTPIDERRCRLELPTDSYDMVAFVMAMLDVDFEVESPPELAERLRVLAARYAAAT